MGVKRNPIMGPFFHATRDVFEEFEIPRNTLGIHVGSEGAAIDRFPRIGTAGIDYNLIEDDDGNWWVDNDTTDEEAGPFKSKAEAQAYIDAQPQDLEPIELEANLNNVIETPDLGTWTFDSAGLWMLQNDIITQAEYEEAWKEWDREKALREILLRKGIDGISYINEVEDPGSESFLILDPASITIVKAALQKAKNPRRLYHVTETKNKRGIQKNGLLPMQPSIWTTGTGERYGKGEIFAFDHIKDAIRWASHMEWELHKTMGSGKISIVEFIDDSKWQIDTSDPLSQAGRQGNWLKKHGRVKPEQIVKITKVTPPMIRSIVHDARYEEE